MKDSDVEQAEKATHRDLSFPGKVEDVGEPAAADPIMPSLSPVLSSMPPAPGTPSKRWVSQAPYGAVVLLGALLRFIDLGARPLHFDESEHA